MNHEQARERVRNHIKTRGYKVTVTTERMVRHWWRILNIAVFYGALEYPAAVIIGAPRGAFASIAGYDHEPGLTVIRMSPEFASKHLFLTVLVHEMVHAWEHRTHTCMGHGKRFFAWKNRIKRTVGLELNKLYAEDEYRYE